MVAATVSTARALDVPVEVFGTILGPDARIVWTPYRIEKVRFKLVEESRGRPSETAFPQLKGKEVAAQ